MRVLALHGFRTSGRILSDQLRALVKVFPDWEFRYLDAPNVATGEPEEIVKVAFPKECAFYEWYGYIRKDDGTYDYENFDRSVQAVVDAVTAEEFDILLGFSQGGCFAAMLTALCEQGMLAIPAHRRWKYTVLLNAPYPRGSRVILGDRWCTAAVLSFGLKDQLVDPSPWATVKTPIKVTTEEGHALPRLPASVKAVSEALRNVTSRRWVAFDFDGVVCDSARETGTTAWLAGTGLFPGADGSSRPPESLLEAFCAARPLLETGFEALVILYRLCVLGESPMDMLNSASPSKDMDEALKKMAPVTKEELKDRFQRARDNWIAQDEAGWLRENGFYTPTVETIKRLIQKQVSVYIVTTKHSSFAVKLLEGVGISLPPDRIFGLGSGKKRDVLTTLARDRESSLGGHCIFIEDRIETLRDVAANAGVPATLVVAGYGYNTKEERRRAREDDRFVVMESSQDLADWLEKVVWNGFEEVR